MINFSTSFDGFIDGHRVWKWIKVFKIFLEMYFNLLMPRVFLICFGYVVFIQEQSVEKYILHNMYFINLCIAAKIFF